MKIEQYKGLLRLRKTFDLVHTLIKKGIAKKICQGEFVSKAEAMPDEWQGEFVSKAEAMPDDMPPSTFMHLMPPSTFMHLMKRGVEFGIIEVRGGKYRMTMKEIDIPYDLINKPTYGDTAQFLAPFATFRGWLACIVVTDAVEINLGGICYACNLFCEESGIKAKSGQPFHFHQGNMSATMKALIETGIIGKRKQGRDSIHFVADAAMLGKLAGLGKMYFKG